MQEEIGERKKFDPIESRHGASARLQYRKVATCTADFQENQFTGECLARDRSARRWSEKSHEVGKCLHPGAVIFRLMNQIASRQDRAVSLRTVLIWKRRCRDAHFIQVRVRSELNQTGILPFPTEFTDGQSTGRKIRDQVRSPSGLRSQALLQLRDAEEYLIRHMVDKTQAEKRCRLALGNDRRLRRHRFTSDATRTVDLP